MAFVQIQAVVPSGRIAAPSSTFVSSHSLLDDSNLPVVSVCNIEHSFPERAPNLANGRQTEEASYEDEAEFEFGSKESSLLGRFEFSGCNATDIATLEQHRGEVVPLEANREAIFESSDLLLRKGLENSTSSKSEAPPSPKNPLVHVDRNLEFALESLANDYRLASDAAFLENYGSLPYLSGASPGFGFDFTPEGIAASSDASSKLTRYGNDSQ
jgi:hypothetical protein